MVIRAFQVENKLEAQKAHKVVNIIITIYLAMIDAARDKNSHLVFAMIIGAGPVALIASLLCFAVPADATSSSPSNPFAPGSMTFHGAAPPRIVMTYDGQKHQGQLIGFAYDKDKPFGSVPRVDVGNITSIDPKGIVSVRNGTSITYGIEGNPPSEAQPDSLFVNVYTTQGQPAAILGTGPSSNLTDNDSNNNDINNMHGLRHTYLINLPKGEYILLSTATWTADEKKQTVNGYVIYGQRIQVI